MKKYYIKTFGCQMNVYDSHRVAGILQSLGWSEAATLKQVDLIIFNTCHIREKATEKLFSDLGRVYLLKQERAIEGKKTVIGVLGCVVQAEDEQIAKRAPYVDFALGPLTYYRLPEILEKIARKSGDTIIETDFPAESKFDFLPQNKSEGGCSYLAIQEGCNNFCTYCVVPYTRGIETSRPIEDVLAEAKKLVAEGTLEINLLGQNVNSYHGEDKNGKERDLAYLLRKLDEIDGLKRIRYTTSYPADVTDDLIRCHAEITKLMPYLHLPIQSGSDAVLRAMNRRHDVAKYLDVIYRLKEANPEIGFSSDFIVGFPGESDKDFEDTLNLVDKVKFIQAFSFKYSRRPGTPAAVMPNQVEEKVKEKRLEILQNKLFDYQLKFNQQTVGKTVEVLFEGKGRHAGQLTGRTPYMQNLYAKADKGLLNKIIRVKVEEATMNSLSGTIVEG